MATCHTDAPDLGHGVMTAGAAPGLGDAPGLAGRKRLAGAAEERAADVEAVIARGEAQPHGARSGRVHPRRRPSSPTVGEPSHHFHSLGERDVLWQRYGSAACTTDERNGADKGVGPATR